MNFKSIAVSTSVLAALGLGAGAFAQDTGFYVQGNGGANFVVQDNADLDIDGLGEFSGSYDADTGYVIGGEFGKQFGQGLRAGVELSFRDNEVNDFDAEGIDLDADGDITSLAVMLNGYYDFATGNPNWVPYVGAGLGYASVESDDEDEGAFAYQLKAGLGHKVGTAGTIGAEASWFATPDLEFDIDGAKVDLDYGNTALQVFYRHAL